MPDLLWTIPALPFAGFLVLALSGGRMPRGGTSLVGVGSVGLAAAMAIYAAARYLSAPPAAGAWSQELWTWWNVGGLSPGIALYMDPLAVVFTLVVTVVGFLIHLYSTGYMADDEGYTRFFAYMNLFVGSMLILVLADNLLLLYLGWEGVGLCSYLLIGFWYRDRANGAAARKAFIVTRIGDTAMAVGLFLLFHQLGTLEIQSLMARAGESWPVGSSLATAAALLLLGGAVGKSAQLPLQTWLPDAMAGPTPVSALIHAATMVTAGVYLIARMHVVFALSPLALALVGVVGAVTLLVAGCSALVQTDIKRVLAYSTISQIGYMFVALGVGAWSAGIFHFMTHACFKALLFLGAGAVIIALGHKQDVSDMGGLRRALPVTFWTFLIGAASLAALPLVTSGFYSKDLILWRAWTAGGAARWLWAAGLAGALLTAVYTFRLVFLVFFGKLRTAPSHRLGAAFLVPLIILAVFSTLAGFVEIPATLGDVPLFSTFLEESFTVPHAAGEHAAGGMPAAAGHAAAETAHGAGHENHGTEALLQIISALIALTGAGIAAIAYLRRPQIAAAWSESALGGTLRRFWFAGWGFDAVYRAVLIRPFQWFAAINRDDIFDAGYTGIAWWMSALHRGLAATQTGRVRFYAAGIVLGAIVLMALMVLR
ncbi:MAG: NADH-quinone oxidoreductase subunit L [Candidatus Eisenbacteria bacterium]|nr:NADH-quinone oxidoreductase subunit L [Candidatus Eisenbacteria bacterium]